MLDVMAAPEASHVPFEVWLFLRLFAATEKAEGASWLLGVLALSWRQLCKHGAAWGRGRGWLLNEGSSSVK